ncbi:MAG: hypothetical protein U0R18_20800 [Mycobacterium sp.]
MADYPDLTHISLGMLLAVGDPWRADETLQRGDPGQIAELATAFRDAGACTTETFNEFAQARERFHESWNRENGEHPIDDSAEVQRATTRLHVQKEQLPSIGADLMDLAATLAAAEKESASKVAELNGKLALLDWAVGQAIADDRDYSKILDQAVEVTAQADTDVERIRDQYTDEMERIAFDLRLEHGYDPAGIEDVDGDGEASPEERGRTAPEHYNANQRAKDEALVNGPGPWTPEKDAAAARLRDFATATTPATDPNVTPEARELASQRLDDFRMANFVGPLPRDPIFGGDGRTRAQSRLELQRQLETGQLGFPPMSPDQATQALNDGESFGRVVTTKQAYFALTSAGMSRDGALKVLADMANGAGPWLKGAETYGDVIPQGKHALPTDLLSAGDAKVLEKLARYGGTAGDAIQLISAASDFFNDPNNPNRYRDAGGALGNVLGGMGGGGAAVALAGSFTNPVTAAIAVGVLAYAAGEGGEWLGTEFGGRIDRSKSAAGG